MNVYPVPEDDEARLLELATHALLDNRLPELDNLATIARQILESDAALVSTIDRHRQWFSGRCGLDVDETPREHSFCTHAIMHPHDTMIVSDAREDPRFAENPLVTGPPHIRKYVGIPIRSGKHAIGVLCVIDREPGVVTQGQVDALHALRDTAETLLEQRRIDRFQAAMGGDHA